jgi:hypothetical protein
MEVNRPGRKRGRKETEKKRKRAGKRGTGA